MPRGKRVLCAILLVIFGAFLPGEGSCYEEDMYFYRILYATVYFEFEKGTVSDGNDNSRFRQVYSFSTLGNILSRWLITYDAALSFSDSTSSSGSTESSAQAISYSLRTSILPGSPIPLTLSATRSTESGESNGTENESTTSNYTLQWDSRLRSLPHTSFNLEHSTSESGQTAQNRTSYALHMSKDLGPTTNNLYYNFITSGDDSGKSSYRSAINFTNTTNFSKATRLNFGYAQGESERNEQGKTAVQGLSLSLSSKPGPEFYQTHRYSYYSSGTEDSKQTGETYAGNLSYTHRFSEKLASSMAMTLSESESRSPTSEQMNASFGANGSLSYRVSKSMSVSQSAGYGYSQATSSASPEIGEHETFSTLTSVSYYTSVRNWPLSCTYGIGYSYEAVPDDSRTGLLQNFSLTLQGIDLLRYALFNVSYALSDTSDGAGSWNRTTNYGVNAVNRVLLKYVSLNAAYNRAEETSWIDLYNRATDNLSFGATSNYFRDTRMQFTSKYSQSSTLASGDDSSSSNNFNVTHTRPLMGGELGLSASFSMSSADYTSGGQTDESGNLVDGAVRTTSSTTSTSSWYSATYSRQLIESLSWRAYAYTVKSAFNNRSSQSTAMDNSLNYRFRNGVAVFAHRYYQADTGSSQTTYLALNYRLRSWLVSLEHRYSLIETPESEQTGSNYFLRLSRSFVRYL